MGNKQNKRKPASNAPPPVDKSLNPPPQLRITLKPPQPTDDNGHSGKPAATKAPVSQVNDPTVYTEELACQDDLNEDISQAYWNSVEIVPRDAPSQSPVPSSHTDASHSSYSTKRHASISDISDAPRDCHRLEKPAGKCHG
ncbi:hypothetical protein M413DRAFT_21260 [Hebeloma cylindrosporum]|uniref:Uncharacterized protein n=1 Tax=Hebeloma cylindrosporum TaxID=76867 RepID=A0A0C3CXS1_HEBCY|nr:hypothetical protein M413DRAFT_21260 [Hebeloma cylindrosporum h7]